MKRRQAFLIGAAVLAVLTSSLTARTHDNDNDKDTNKAAGQDTIVHFGQPQPQPVAAVGSPLASSTHFLLPDDVTIRKGATVTFVVNGGGHGIAIHPVSKNTTRADIAEDLCQGGQDDADRFGRAANDCNGNIQKSVTIAGADALVTGTQNLDYNITDGKDDLIIHTGFNVNIAATPTTPAIVIANPRVDDTEHTHRLLATSGRATGDATAPGANPAGAFLTGSAAPATPGNRIQVRFLKTGRYLVICMNRGHSLNDHMFGFVNVVGDDEN